MSTPDDLDPVRELLRLIDLTNERIELYETIPERVKSCVPLKVARSDTRGAGRGVFVLEAVKAGDLIFSVAKPLICIVDDSEEVLETTCDNCFASRSDGLRTVTRKDLKFSACAGCWVLHYCSKECQAEAWAHHHKYECESIAKLKFNAVDGDIGEDAKYTSYRSFRCALRILCLRAKKQISDEAWAEFSSLQTHALSHSQESNYSVWANNCAKIFIDYKITELGTEEIVSLIYAIKNNELSISLPVLRNSRAFDIDKYDISGGCTLEPFTALINHACVPNSWWVNEGPELRVRAAKDMPAGRELTFNYLSTRVSEFHEHRASLQHNWHFDCTCAMCSCGADSFQPTEPLLSDLSRTIDQATPESILRAPKQHLAKTQAAIKALAATDLGLGVWPTEKLYSILYTANMSLLSYPRMLKTHLKIYYDVQPAQNLPPMPYQRLGSLRVLITLVSTETAHHFPKNVQRLVPSSLYLHLRGKLVRDTVKCWGEDSEVARFEQGVYGEEFGGVEGKAEVKMNRNAKRQFGRDVNRLLEWAGLKARKVEELV